MQNIRIINTFPDFLEFWGKNQNLPLEVQIESWLSDYISKWPELLEMQLNDYTSQQIDWRQIASTKIFPFLNSRLAAMQQAQQNIMATFHYVCNQVEKKFGFNSSITCILYVGIGCGAGWVTIYEEEPAILFGLENIAECHWSSKKAITGLTAHEFGHIIQAVWRKEAGKPEEESAWWQLYTEGFAQRCEHLILEEETWHRAENSDNSWLNWCKDKKAYLASEFLRFVTEGIDIRPFFGSWHNIDGYSQCGYFLGHEAIKELQLRGMSMREIATLDYAKQYLQEILSNFSENI